VTAPGPCGPRQDLARYFALRRLLGLDTAKERQRAGRAARDVLAHVDDVDPDTLPAEAVDLDAQLDGHRARCWLTDPEGPEERVAYVLIRRVEGATLAEIGAEIARTHERVRQMEREGLRWLRARLGDAETRPVIEPREDRSEARASLEEELQRRAWRERVLGPERGRVLDALQSGRWLSLPRLEERAQVSTRVVREVVSRLSVHGLVARRVDGRVRALVSRDELAEVWR